jgi:nuclear transport factor 2 (NTF2) superfamily protein
VCVPGCVVRSHGNEQWQFTPEGLMERREASINDVSEDLFVWVAGRACAWRTQRDAYRRQRDHEDMRLYLKGLIFDWLRGSNQGSS